LAPSSSFPEEAHLHLPIAVSCSRITHKNFRGVESGSNQIDAGCTGHCFGDHIHFEVRVNGTAFDPAAYL
jgi:hypothetical protein